jgi:hypothetical protein
MKKIIMSIMLLTMSNTIFSQQINPTPTFTKQEYLLKSKHQKTAAWILLGGGFTLSMIGVISATPKVAEDVGSAIVIIPGIIVGVPPPETPQNDYTAETILLISGTAAMITSISLFIASGKNKRKAMSLSFINESAPQLQKGSFVYKTIPSLKLKISL